MYRILLSVKFETIYAYLWGKSSIKRLSVTTLNINFPHLEYEYALNWFMQIQVTYNSAKRNIVWDSRFCVKIILIAVQHSNEYTPL